MSFAGEVHSAGMDKRALSLVNSAAAAELQEYQDALIRDGVMAQRVGVINDYDAEVLSGRRAIWNTTVANLACSPFTGVKLYVDHGQDQLYKAAFWWRYHSSGLGENEGVDGPENVPASYQLTMGARFDVADLSEPEIDLLRHLVRTDDSVSEEAVVRACRDLDIPTAQFVFPRKSKLLRANVPPSRATIHQRLGESVLGRANRFDAELYVRASGRRKLVAETHVLRKWMERPDTVEFVSGFYDHMSLRPDTIPQFLEFLGIWRSRNHQPEIVITPDTVGEAASCIKDLLYVTGGVNFGELDTINERAARYVPAGEPGEPVVNVVLPQN